MKRILAIATFGVALVLGNAGSASAIFGLCVAKTTVANRPVVANRAVLRAELCL